MDIVSLEVKFDSKKAMKTPGESEVQYTKRLQVLKQRYEYERRYSEGLYFQVDKEISRLLDTVPVKKNTGKKPAVHPAK